MQVSKRAYNSSANMVRMTGLDTKTTVKDIEKFFAPLPIRRVILLENGRQRFYGTANVFFDSRPSASRAMERNYENIRE